MEILNVRSRFTRNSRKSFRPTACSSPIPPASASPGWPMTDRRTASSGPFLPIPFGQKLMELIMAYETSERPWPSPSTKGEARQECVIVRRPRLRRQPRSVHHDQRGVLHPGRQPGPPEDIDKAMMLGAIIHRPPGLADLIRNDTLLHIIESLQRGTRRQNTARLRSKAGPGRTPGPEVGKGVYDTRRSRSLNPVWIR